MEDIKPDTKPTPNALSAALQQFSGSEEFHRHWLRMLYTDGVKFMAENAGAYWLIDAVASYLPRIRKDARLSEIAF